MKRPSFPIPDEVLVNIWNSKKCVPDVIASLAKLYPRLVKNKFFVRQLIGRAAYLRRKGVCLKCYRHKVDVTSLNKLLAKQKKPKPRRI